MKTSLLVVDHAILGKKIERRARQKWCYMDNLICYEIRDWERCYTVSQNRKNDPDKPLPWVAMRTKHDGKGYRRVMRQPDAMALLGAWMLIVEVAAKCPTHGVLSDSDGPLTAIDLADKTGGDEATFERALQVFSSKGIEWLTTTTLPERYQSIRTTGRDGTGRDGTERDGTKQDENKNPSTRRSATRPTKSPGGSARASGVRVDLSEEVLSDPLRLAQWAEEEAGRSDGWISTSEADRANVIATASKALQASGVRSRVGLFKWIVSGRRWEYLRFEDEQIAATILAAEPAKERASISEFVDVPSLKLPEADGISTEQRRADLRKQIEAAGKR